MDNIWPNLRAPSRARGFGVVPGGQKHQFRRALERVLHGLKVLCSGVCDCPCTEQQTFKVLPLRKPTNIKECRRWVTQLPVSKSTAVDSRRMLNPKSCICIYIFNH